MFQKWKFCQELNFFQKNCCSKWVILLFIYFFSKNLRHKNKTRIYNCNYGCKGTSGQLWSYDGVVVITAARLHSTKPALGFCAGSYPARGMSEIRDSEDLSQWSRLEIHSKRLSSVNHNTKTIHHHHHHHHYDNSNNEWIFKLIF